MLNPAVEYQKPQKQAQLTAEQMFTSDCSMPLIDMHRAKYCPVCHADMGLAVGLIPAFYFS